MESAASEVQYERAHITDNATHSIIAANAVCTMVAGSAVLLRIISRRLKRLSLGADDYMAMLAMLFALGFLATAIFGLHVGLGKHIILSKDPVAYGKDETAALVFYATGVVPMKLSLIFLYRRIFPNRWLHIALWVVGGVVTCMSIVADCLAVLNSPPLKTIKLRSINYAVWIVIHAWHTVVTDFVLLCLPMPLVWRLNMSRTRKIQVSGIFALGAFASIASFIRISYLKASTSHYLDTTWVDAPGITWSMVELCMGITSACLPTLGPIVTYIRKGPSTSPMAPRSSFTPERATPESVLKIRRTNLSTWTDFKTWMLDQNHWDNLFSQPENSPQEDVEHNGTTHPATLTSTLDAIKAQGGMVAVRSCGSSIYDEDRSLNDGIEVTIYMQQDAYNLNKF